jgi:hypothetical protein
MFRTVVLPSVLFFALFALAASIAHQSLALAAIGTLSLIVAVLAAALIAERGE